MEPKTDAGAALVDALRGLLRKPIGPSVGWLHTLGSLSLALFLLQVATGVLLAMVYIPSPDHAHTTVRALMASSAGRMVRGLHFWGATFMVVAVTLHMLRVLVLGAYKRPRHWTWAYGVGLLFITLGFGFTGYLLPWDQKAFWATTVGTYMAGTVPAVGPLLMALIRGAADVGAATLSRFYALHTLVFPLLLAGLIAVHLYLVQVHGIAEDEPSDPRLARPFVPDHLAKDAAVTLVAFAALLVLAALMPPHLEAVADPLDETYLPKPEWYFYFYYELLKLFMGPWLIAGTVVLPVLATLVLLALPLLDRAPVTNPHYRPVALAIIVAIVATVAYLTSVTATSTPRPRTFKVAEGRVTPQVLRGIQVYDRLGCASCHSIQGAGMKSAPDLWRVGARRSSEWIAQLLQDPQKALPGTVMFRYRLSEDELQALVAYLASLDLERHRPVEVLPTWREPKEGTR
ncbi:MAG: cytochrome b N-terminal domain-containing protein [Armatimonadetes bacterium]|nr:cytochrome b N-terminal domain-containing protein [Armatimonadota bacterium]